VLFHPVLEEKLAVLEEYNWQHPLDLVLVATGNPTGFSHVNDIPRPLLDRLELIYMDLPDEAVERKIMLAERFSEKRDRFGTMAADHNRYFTPEEIARKVAAPWWVIDIVNKAVRHSRICQFVERRPSIRATIRALDHTYASVEIENKQVATIRHALYGLRLALRGRIGLRADLIDFEEPRRTFVMAGQLAEDFLWNAFANIVNDRGFLGEWDRKKAGLELTELTASGIDLSNGMLAESVLEGYEELSEMVHRMRKIGEEMPGSASSSELEANLYKTEDEEAIAALNYSALEMLANMCMHAKTISEARAKPLFIANEYV
jgi:hypothetical protein